MSLPDEFKGEAPRLIAVSSPTGRLRYELWRTPHVKPGWYLKAFENEVEISRKPIRSELQGRIEFEKKVEEHSV